MQSQSTTVFPESSLDKIEVTEVKDLVPLDFGTQDDVNFFTTQMTDILSTLNFSQKHIELMLSPESLATTWIPGFTHSSITNREGENYETLELLGDKFLGAALVEYIRRGYTKDGLFVVPPSKISTADSLYLAEDYQIKFSNLLGLHNLTSFDPRLRFTTNSKILEDVFESFAGCIYMALTDRVHQSVGFDGVFNLMNFIMSSVDFDAYGATESATTVFKEMWMDLSPGNTGVYTYDGGEMKLVISGSITGTFVGTGVSEREAKNNASRLAVDFLIANNLSAESQLDKKNRHIMAQVTAYKQPTELAKAYTAMYTAMSKLNSLSDIPEKLVIFEVKIKFCKLTHISSGTLKVGYSQNLEFPLDSVTWSGALSMAANGNDPTQVKITLLNRFVDTAFQ